MLRLEPLGHLSYIMIMSQKSGESRVIHIKLWDDYGMYNFYKWRNFNQIKIKIFPSGLGHKDIFFLLYQRVKKNKGIYLFMLAKTGLPPFSDIYDWNDRSIFCMFMSWVYFYVISYCPIPFCGIFFSREVIKRNSKMACYLCLDLEILLIRPFQL